MALRRRVVCKGGRGWRKWKSLRGVNSRRLRKFQVCMDGAVGFGLPIVAYMIRRFIARRGHFHAI